MPIPILVFRTLPRKHGGGEKVHNAVQADHLAGIKAIGTTTLHKIMVVYRGMEIVVCEEIPAFR